MEHMLSFMYLRKFSLLSIMSSMWLSWYASMSYIVVLFSLHTVFRSLKLVSVIVLYIKNFNGNSGISKMLLYSSLFLFFLVWICSSFSLWSWYSWSGWVTSGQALFSLFPFSVSLYVYLHWLALSLLVLLPSIAVEVLLLLQCSHGFLSGVISPSSLSVSSKT